MNTSGQTIRWGIIGCGEVTEKKSGPAFNKVPHSQLVAVMRRNAHKAADYAKRHAVARWYADAEALVHDAGVNAVYIATPPDKHLFYTRMALEAGKPVYVEKPMVLNSREAEEMALLAQRFQDKIVVAHYRRWWPQFTLVKNLLDAGAIGNPVRATISYRRKPLTTDELQKPGVQWRINPAISGGGLFHDLAPHQLDLLLYWFGPVQHAHGFSLNHLGAYDAPDWVSVRAAFKNGVLMQGSWNFAAPENMQEDLLVIEGDLGRISTPAFWNPEILLENKDGKQYFPLPLPEHNQIYLIEQVVRFFRGETTNPCPVKDALDGMRIMDACTSSIGSF